VSLCLESVYGFDTLLGVATNPIRFESGYGSGTLLESGLRVCVSLCRCVLKVATVPIRSLKVATNPIRLESGYGSGRLE
jgi:hypothetical protein